MTMQYKRTQLLKVFLKALGNAGDGEQKHIPTLHKLLEAFSFIHHCKGVDSHKELDKVESKASGLRIKFTDGTMISPSKLSKRLKNGHWSLVYKKFKPRKLNYDTK